MEKNPSQFRSLLWLIEPKEPLMTWKPMRICLAYPACATSGAWSKGRALNGQSVCNGARPEMPPRDLCQTTSIQPSRED